MRVGIDTAPVSQHRGRGVGALGAQLLGALLRARSPHSFLLFAHAGTPEAALAGESPRAGARTRPAVAAGLSLGMALDQHRLARQLRREGPDLYHAFFQWNLPLRRPPMPVVGHVYDLMPLAVREIYTGRYGLPVGGKIRLYGAYLRYALRRVDRVIAISENTRRDLVRLTGYPGERVGVVYPAPAPGMGEEVDEARLAALRERLGLPEDYFLYVGGYDYRKNVEVLLRAYARARGGVEIPLALAGGMESPYGKMIRSMIDAAGPEAGLRPVGHVDGADLPALYTGARLVLYPSLYEGFGLPVLDAMACGAPVACSDAASLPEAAGEAGILLPPGDEEAWAGAMCRLAGESGLREELGRKGRNHAARFSWERAAREVISVYERAPADGAGGPA